MKLRSRWGKRFGRSKRAVPVRRARPGDEADFPRCEHGPLRSMKEIPRAELEAIAARYGAQLPKGAGR